MSADDDQRIAQIHHAAVERGDHHYIDPVTGFLVMTALHHLDRGECCSNGCRHCPFDTDSGDDAER